MTVERFGPFVVEIPRGGRGLVSPEPLPVHAGFLPGTVGPDRRPLGAFLCDEEPARPGEEIMSRLIGVLPARDEPRVLCVREASPARGPGDLPAPLREALVRFTGVPVANWGDAHPAAAMADEARGRWAGELS